MGAVDAANAGSPPMLGDADFNWYLTIGADFRANHPSHGSIDKVMRGHVCSSFTSPTFSLAPTEVVSGTADMPGNSVRLRSPRTWRTPAPPC